MPSLTCRPSVAVIGQPGRIHPVEAGADGIEGGHFHHEMHHARTAPGPLKSPRL